MNKFYSTVEIIVSPITPKFNSKNEHMKNWTELPLLDY